LPNEKVNDGGPAFPRVAPTPSGDAQFGMSLRDWFAGMAIGGRISLLEQIGKNPGISIWEEAAMNAYKFADAMLKERSK